MLLFWEPHIEDYQLEYVMVHTRALESKRSSHLSDHGKVFKSLQLSLSVAKAANCLPIATVLPFFHSNRIFS